ncbi:MAG TPA: hypothetical protein VGP90_01590 [Acidimicrobiia bacterium]|nr:hypothetical protein [Acidimicrobiia bacterium]
MRTLAGREGSDGTVEDYGVAPDEVTDEELTALALAADPDTPVGDDATSFFDGVGPDAGGLLPEWYMPGVAGAGRLTAWRRSVALIIVAAFLLITAYGLCNAYGDMVLNRIG